jgi:hypothetical protein
MTSIALIASPGCLCWTSAGSGLKLSVLGCSSHFAGAVKQHFGQNPGVVGISGLQAGPGCFCGKAFADKAFALS